jgi:hypothetical protein
MLLLKALELLLHFSQPLQLRHGSRLGRRRVTHELAVTHLLAPLRQHEWVNAQGLRPRWWPVLGRRSWHEVIQQKPEATFSLGRSGHGSSPP